MSWTSSLAMIFSLLTGNAPAPAPGTFWVYVGTYTSKGSRGIYRFQLDPATGKVTTPELAAKVSNPSFLAVHPEQRFLYCVNEVDTSDGKKGGAVTAFALDTGTGKLTALNHDSTRGAGPCHLVVDRTGRNVLAANYGGGSVCVLPVGPDGKVGPATSFIQHTGSSIDKGRQSGPHAHSVNLDAANHFAFVADLGLDKVLIYRFDADKGTLTPNDPPAATVTPGAGPRHFAFHPNGRYAYVINELNSTITAFNYDAADGILKTVQTVTTLPEGYKGRNYPAEVQVHPSGKFVYGSNRGHDSIAVFTADPQTGLLTPAGHQGHHIKNPRNFGIDPTGSFMLVANQDADIIVVFRIDPNTGALTPTGDELKVSMPVCVKMIAVKKSGE